MSTNPEPTTSLSISVKKMLAGQQALPSLKTIQGLILEDAQTELRFPESINTYNKMGLDANLASALSVFEMMISRVKWKIEAPEKSSQEDKDRAAKLNDNIHNLDRPWTEYVNEISSILKYGFCSLEKVYENREFEGDGYIGWKHFPVISQNSIEHWFFDNKTGSLKGLKQNTTDLQNTILYNSKIQEKEIPKKKFILFRHNPKKDNPEGNSPMKSCYLTWKYISVIEEFEAIGVAKDVGGIAVFEIDQEYYRIAMEDENSFQAKNLEDLKRYAASMTAGDQSYLFLPMAYNDQGKPLFSFKLQGIEGGGKQYKTSEIVTRHANKLLMSFFADVLKLGAESQGSYALADSKTSLLAMAIESILENIQRTLNHDLIRQTYSLNKWDYNPVKAAQFTFGDLEKEDLDELSSAVQRVMAVGGVRPTSDIEDTLREKIFGLQPMGEANPEILETESTSRSSDGMKKGLGNGTGDSTSKGGDRSKGNKENK